MLFAFEGKLHASAVRSNSTVAIQVSLTLRPDCIGYSVTKDMYIKPQEAKNYQMNTLHVHLSVTSTQAS